VTSHYLALIHSEAQTMIRRIWKLKVALKIRIFLWFLRRGVILTKDNLVKRNRQGSKLCCFYHHHETIQHLFFDCRLSRLVWAVIHTAFGLPKPCSVRHILGWWLMGLLINLNPLCYMEQRLRVCPCGGLAMLLYLKITKLSFCMLLLTQKFHRFVTSSQKRMIAERGNCYPKRSKTQQSPESTTSAVPEISTTKPRPGNTTTSRRKSSGPSKSFRDAGDSTILQFLIWQRFLLHRSCWQRPHRGA
jgi:hypothetical protein